MKQYQVTGMSCAACSARVEKAVSHVPGVQNCSVSLLTNSMGVEGTASDAEIIKAVEAAGYGASVKGAPAAGRSEQHRAEEEALEDHETPRLKKRLIASLGFLLILMYFSMGHMMWGFPLPAWFDGNHVAHGLVQMILAAIVMLINRKFFISGFRSVMHGAPNMDTLVALGSSASFVWSVYALFAMTDAQVHGGSEAAMVWMDSFYFESAAMILTLITVGKMLEVRSKGKTTNALKSLMKLSPKTATILEGGQERVVPVEKVQVGDLFVVRPGESIPVDGVIEEGITAVNEAALTGESIPADKQPGDRVSAATVNQSGLIRCRASRVGEDTTLSQIIRMVSDAAATKAPIAKTADKVAGVFVPAVIGIAALTLVIWLLVGKPFGYALARAISVLVISCPCAMGLATPVAIMVGNGVGARHGILFKTAVSLEETGRAATVIMDKTGTITKGEPSVTDVLPAGGVTETELLQAAYDLEACSEHPLAKAVVAYAAGKGMETETIGNFTVLPGHGLTGMRQSEELYGGSLEYMGGRLSVPDTVAGACRGFAEAGKTPFLFAKDQTLLGVIAVADTIKEESTEAIRSLKNMGIHTVMLTGDNEQTARAIARQAGVDEVIAGVLPDGKESVVRRFKKKGSVIMVGDGINDAPALTRADIGMAIGAGTDIAIDAADIVLMRSSLQDVPAAIRLSRATLTNIHENLFWAFFYNVIGIPLAAGAFISLFGWEMNPMFGAAAMSLSSFCVVSNALRLNLFDLYSQRHDRKIHIKEKKNMTKTMKINGMMCMHCENRVKKALEALDGVTEAQVSHEKGEALVTLSAPVDDAVLKKAVEDQDYQVTSIA